MVATYFTRGLGCKFQRSADTGSTYVDTMAVVDMKPAGRARATIDVSNLTDEDDEFAAAARTIRSLCSLRNLGKGRPRIVAPCRA